MATMQRQSSCTERPSIVSGCIRNSPHRRKWQALHFLQVRNISAANDACFLVFQGKQDKSRLHRKHVSYLRLFLGAAGDQKVFDVARLDNFYLLLALCAAFALVVVLALQKKWNRLGEGTLPATIHARVPTAFHRWKKRFYTVASRILSTNLLQRGRFRFFVEYLATVVDVLASAWLKSHR